MAETSLVASAIIIAALAARLRLYPKSALLRTESYGYILHAIQKHFI